MSDATDKPLRESDKRSPDYPTEQRRDVPLNGTSAYADPPGFLGTPTLADWEGKSEEERTEEDVRRRDQVITADPDDGYETPEPRPGSDNDVSERSAETQTHTRGAGDAANQKGSPRS